MKFGKTWKANVARLPRQQRAAVVNYAAWKKQTSRSDGDELTAKLAADCKVASDRFRRLAKGLVTRTRCAVGAATQALEFASLNRTCVTKLCKRLEKRGIVPGIRGWLATHRRQYAFFGGAEVAALELRADADARHAMTCPVCLEESLGETECVILNCGHTFCAPCVLNMMGVWGMRGTTRNLIGYANFSGTRLRACPSCRDGAPTQNMRSWQIVDRPREAGLVAGLLRSMSCAAP
jgi:hypothetical protein